MNASAITERLRPTLFIWILAIVWLLLVAFSFLGPILISSDPESQAMDRRLLAPSWTGGAGGILGTDQLGRPVWLRVMYGLRTSYSVGLMAVAVGLLVGVTAGLVAGYYGRAVDRVIMGLVDIQLSFPALLLIMTLTRSLGQSLWVLVVVLGLTSWMLYARVVRAKTMILGQTDFIAATLSLGATTVRVLGRHLLPNSAAGIVAVATLELARIMLAEATLSFLGFGVQPPTVSLGSLIASGRDYLVTHPWVSISGGLILSIAVLTTNLLGSWLEGASDARQLVANGLTER